MTMRDLLPLALLAGLGCPSASEDPPPPDFVGDSDLTLYNFGHFDAADPLEMRQGIEALEESLAEVDLTGAQAGRRWDGGAQLGPADYGGADIWEDADPLDQVVVTVAGRAAHDLTDYAPLILLPDQTPFESSSSVQYDRTLISDGDCFAAQTCDRLETTNAVHRQNFILNVFYDTPKFMRWIELTDGRKALVMRAWLQQAYVGVTGTNTLEQFTGLEIRIPDGNGGSILQTTLWGVLNPSIGDLALSNSVANGIDEAWENTDAYLDAN